MQLLAYSDAPPRALPNPHVKQPGQNEELNAPWTQLRAKDIVPNGDTQRTVFKAVKHYGTPTVIFFIFFNEH